MLLLTAVLLWLNQVCFVLALDATSASTIGLLIGTIPIFAALFGLALGRERLGRALLGGRGVSFLGVALVALGAGGDVSGGYAGVLARARHRSDVGRVLGRGRAAHEDVLAVAGQRCGHPGGVGPHRARRPAGDDLAGLGRRVGGLDAARSSRRSARSSSRTCSGSVSLHRIGPARATLAANLQPFVAAVLAVVLLSEPLGLLQIAGGVLIAVGIFVARRRTAPAQAA